MDRIIGSTTKLLQTLRARGVIAVAAAYLVGAFALIQVVSVVVPALRLPEWVNTLSVVGVVLGFPIALVLAWMFRWTPQGFERDAPSDPVQRPAAVALAALLLVGAGSFAAWQITRSIARHPGYAPPSHGATGSVAVLRCENDADPALEYLAKGLAEEFAVRLSQLDALKVVIGNRTLSDVQDAPGGLAGFGSAVQVEHVLSCSLRPTSDGLRATVRLVDSSTDALEWSESFDAGRSELIRTIDNVATATADHLLERLVGPDRARLVRHRTQSPEALDLFLKAHALWQEWQVDDANRALALLDEAVAADPSFALAHIEKAAVLETLYQFGDMTRAQIMSRFQQIIDAAAAIAPDLPELHALRGQVLAQYQMDRAGAIREFELALERSPRSLHVVYYACNSGNIIVASFAIDVCARFRSLYPDDPFAWTMVGASYNYARDYERAIAEFGLAESRFPDYWLAPWLKGVAEVASGRCEDAVRSEERAMALYGQRTQDVLAIYAMALVCGGRRADGEAALAEIPAVDPKWAPDPNVYRAPAMIAAGQFEAALRACQASIERKSFMGLDCFTSFYLDAFREDRRVQEVERRFGLPAVPPERRVPAARWVRPAPR